MKRSSVMLKKKKPSYLFGQPGKKWKRPHVGKVETFDAFDALKEAETALANFKDEHGKQVTK